MGPLWTTAVGFRGLGDMDHGYTELEVVLLKAQHLLLHCCQAEGLAKSFSMLGRDIAATGVNKRARTRVPLSVSTCGLPCPACPGFSKSLTLKSTR